QALLDELGLDASRVEDIYPLSPMQQGMLFHSLQDTGSGVYVNQLSAEIIGLDGARLRAAWQLVSDRHAILRTGFLWQGLSGGARQVVHRRIEVPFVEEDWRGRPVDAAALRAAAEAERQAGFDLSQPPLQRVRLIRLDDTNHQLIWTRHHILTDGWSSARLMGEILSAYHDRPLPPAPPPYSDYIAWLQGRDQAASERFWREQLSALDAPTLVSAAVLPARREAGHVTLPLRLAPSLVGQLQAFAGRERITLNTLIQAAWALLLQRYTGEAVVSFGSTVAGRPADLPGAEEMLGLFINTLPVVARPQPAMAVGDWLRGLQEQNLALREHEHTPLNEIQRWAGYPGQPLFDSNIVFENYPIDRAMQQPGAALRVVAASSHVETSYPLTLTVVPNADTIEIAYRYRRDALDQALITQMHRHLGHCLEALSSDGEKRLDDAAMASLAAEASEEVRVETMDLAARSILPPILAAEARQPAATAAVVDGAGETSHGALASRSNRLAHWLMSRGVGAEARIGICADRNAGFVTALLGVLKAGAAYVPLDASWPAARLAQVAA
ncbi:condensation domain-containing protein, partial [Plastoroseomonas hellenica]|uniref:condensation domain-containing protein n=1 Tax=Plastoroseomonas hellenica TaxID=2687306 RepID=UPI001BA6A353